MEWINIKDQRPDRTGQFLTHAKGGNFLVCMYDINQNAFYLHGGYSVHVDFWAEIPEPEYI